MPTNVTEWNIENERKIIRRLGKGGFTSFVHHCDDEHALFDAEGVAPNGNPVLFEFRTRDKTGESLNKEGGQYLNCYKYWNGVHVARARRTTYVLIVCDSNGVLWFHVVWNALMDDKKFLDNANMKYAVLTRSYEGKSRGQDATDNCFAYNLRLTKFQDQGR